MKAREFVAEESRGFLVVLPVALVEAARERAAAEGGSFRGALRVLLRAYVAGRLDVQAEGRPWHGAQNRREAGER
jgi:hypothetical protein